MRETELIVVRHGETEWNIQGRWQGHQDSPLTDNGLNQAKATAKALRVFKTSALYSSDLGRTVQTAQCIAEETGHTIAKDKRLRERHLGIFQGLTTAEMSSKYPQEYDFFRTGGADYQVPRGESIQQRFDRSIECFNELGETHPGESVIVVTHGGVLDGLFRYVIGLELDTSRRYKIWNCSLNLFSIAEKIWQLSSFGDINHLRALKTLDDE